MIFFEILGDIFAEVFSYCFWDGLTVMKTRKTNQAKAP